MQLSRQAQYAIRTALDLALHPQGRRADIAARQGIPPSLMARVIAALSRTGLVRTYRGVGGGVRLARRPEAVTLGEVVAAVEGPLAINLCVYWGDCPCRQPCPVRAVFARTEGAVARELAVTVGDLARRWREIREPRSSRIERPAIRRTIHMKGGKRT